MMHRRVLGISLMEILVVIVIIALLIALALPVINSMRKRSQMTNCMTNLRQLASALTMYRNDYGEYPVYLELAFANYIKEPKLLICPAEPHPEMPQVILRRALPSSIPQRVITSYYYFYDISGNLSKSFAQTLQQTPEEYLIQTLRSVDPNHGLLACILHGERTRYYDSHNDYSGLTLRVLQDGSVQRVQTGKRWYTSQVDGAYTGRRDMWTLFTDAPCPREFCHQED